MYKVFVPRCGSGDVTPPQTLTCRLEQICGSTELLPFQLDLTVWSILREINESQHVSFHDLFFRADLSLQREVYACLRTGFRRLVMNENNASKSTIVFFCCLKIATPNNPPVVHLLFKQQLSNSETANWFQDAHMLTMTILTRWCAVGYTVNPGTGGLGFDSRLRSWLRSRVGPWMLLYLPTSDTSQGSMMVSPMDEL